MRNNKGIIQSIIVECFLNNLHRSNIEIESLKGPLSRDIHSIIIFLNYFYDALVLSDKQLAPLVKYLVFA